MNNIDEIVRPIVKPQHEMCIIKTDSPMVVVKQMIDARDPGHPKQENPTMNIQWFGRAKVRLPEDSQFLFPVLTNPDSIEWIHKPQLFRVVFLGQIKDWPKPEAVQSMIEAFRGNNETWIAWLVSSIVGMQHSDGIGPASFAVKVALLGDGNCGIITPQPYTNMEVLAEENQKVAAH